MKTARLAIAGKVVVPRLLVAARMGERMRGLLGRATLPVGTGMLLKPCGSIHTVGMQFSLDVIFLDRQNRVVRTISALRPNRFGFGGHGAHATVECSAGWFDMASVSRGDLLEILF
jgi:uncharacterized membrane protein (UPF0127 family)